MQKIQMQYQAKPTTLRAQLMRLSPLFLTDAITTADNVSSVHLNSTRVRCHWPSFTIPTCCSSSIHQILTLRYYEGWRTGPFMK